MNCHVKYTGTKEEVLKRAVIMTASLQAQLEGNAITCRVRNAGRGWEITDENGPSIIAMPTGQTVEEVSGSLIKL